MRNLKFTWPMALAATVALGLLSQNAFADVLAEQCPANPAFEKLDTQTLVNEANRQAELGDTLAAICRYKLALVRLPGQATLKNNLSVLAFNHAMQLNQNHDYAAARDWLAVSRQTNPSATETAEAIAVTYINEARHRQDTDANPDFPAYEGLIRQAMVMQPANSVYKQHLASLLATEATALSHAGQLTEAEAKLIEARTLDPEHPALRRALAQVHIQQAQQAEAGSEAQKTLLEKAVALSPEVKPTADKIKRGESIKAAPNTSLLRTAENPPSGDNLPIEGKMAAIEKLLGMTPTPGSDMPTRLATVEKNLYGVAQKKGGLIERADRAYYSLVGSGQTLQHSPTELTVAIQTLEGTYLKSVLENTQGRVVRWARFPLGIWVELPDEKKPWPGQLSKEATLAAIKQGIERWVFATNQFVTVVWPKDETAADIIVRLDDTYTDRFANPQTAAVLAEYALPKTSNLAKALGVASMFAPGYYGLAPRAGAAALQYREAQKIDRVKEESEIHLGWNVMTTPEQIANVTAYEFGHALGLKGASPDPSDLMHPQTPQVATTAKPISPADKATLKALYERPAAIILNLQ